MKRKKKRTAVRVLFLYALLTAGSWMFLNSYSNSYNRYSEEKIEPVSLSLDSSKAELNIIDRTVKFSLSELAPESKLYCAMYLVSPDDLRLAAYLISLGNGV